MADKQVSTCGCRTLQHRESDYNPFMALQNAMHRDFDALSRRIFGEDLGAGFPKFEILPSLKDVTPRVNVSEKEGFVEIEAEVPGMSSKDLDVSVMDNVLTLKAEHEEEAEKKDKEMHRKEFSYGSFERRIPLPVRVVADKATATFDKGILKLTFPVDQADLNRVKRVPIKVA